MTPTTHITDVKKGGKQNVGTAKIRSITVETIKSNWINKILASKDGSLWLQFKDEKGLARDLTCKICSQYVDKIKHMREFREAWVTGSQNYKVSNANDHADSASHKMAMKYYYHDVNVNVVPENGQTSLDTAFAKGDEKVAEKTKRKLLPKRSFLSKNTKRSLTWKRCMAFLWVRHIETIKVVLNSSII